MNAVRAPSFMSPDWIRWPPNQTTATEDRLTTIMIIGIIPATSSAECRLFRVSSRLMASNRRDLVGLADEAADDVGSDDLLAQYPADPVDEALALPV